MNKQEVIEELMSKSREIIFGDDENVYLSRKRTIELVSQIDQPQKVAVPKHVVEWYERNKDDLNTAIYSTITRTYRKVNGENDDLLDTFESWLVYQENSILILVQMQLFGFEIEQEKLYTVEIPDPNSRYTYRFLSKNDRGVFIDGSCDDCWKDYNRNHLTEAEIKQDFEWAWQFATPVEVE